MPTLNEYFRTEAQDFLTALERSLQRSPAPDATELHRSVRGLRGTAQMAREQRVFDVVSAFEAVTRSLAGGALTWSDHVASRARATIDDLRVLLDGTEDDEQLDARVNDAAARWSDSASAPVPAPADPAADNGTREFREFTAREAAGIADALDTGVRDLQANPMDREPLKVILRRQRALLGAARLEEIPVVSDILRAVEDLTRVIAKLDVPVKKEWLDIYRVARDALQTTIAPLLHDKQPESSHAVSRLRHMREELLERYGEPEAEAPPPDHAFVQPLGASREAAHTSYGNGAGSVESGAAPIEAEAVLDLAADDVVEDEAVLDLGADDVVEDEAVLDLGADDVMEDEAVLDLAADDVIEDEAVLDLAADDVIEDEAVLDLGANDVIEDEAVLDLGADDVVEDEAVLDLGTADVVEDEAVLDLDAADVVEDEAVLDLLSGDVVGEATPAWTRDEVLQRALELRDVILRAGSDDPQVRDAAEELLDLIRIALA